MMSTRSSGRRRRSTGALAFVCIYVWIDHIPSSIDRLNPTITYMLQHSNDNEGDQPPIVRVAGLGWRSSGGAGDGAAGGAEGEGELVFEADSDWGDSDAEVSKMMGFGVIWGGGWALLLYTHIRPFLNPTTPSQPPTPQHQPNLTPGGRRGGRGLQRGGPPRQRLPRHALRRRFLIFIIVRNLLVG